MDFDYLFGSSTSSLAFVQTKLLLAK